MKVYTRRNRLLRHIFLRSLAIAAVCLGLALSLRAQEKTVAELVKAAQKAVKAGEFTQAYLLYAEAATKDPTNIKLWAQARSLEPLAVSAKPLPPSGAPEQTTDSSLLGSITERDLAEAKQLAPPPEVEARPGSRDLNLRGDARAVFEQTAAEFGLRVIFDPAYQPSTGLRLQLSGVDFRAALRAVEAASNSFAVPVNSTVLLVANDTAQKHQEFDPLASVVVPIPEPFAIQEVQEIATAVRGTLDLQRLLVDSQRRLVLIRDRVSKTLLAKRIIADFMRPKAQVAIGIEILDVSKTSALDYGLSLPNSFGLAWFGNGPSNLTATYPAGFTNFVSFGGGHSLIGIAVANAGLFATVSRSSATTLLNADLFTSDGQAAAFHVGDRFPIPTNMYIGTVTSGQQSYTPPPSFNFEDLGLVLKITPHVNGTEEISLDVNAEFKLLGGSAVDGIPVIENRKYESKVGLSTGEWAILAGLMTDSDAKIITGIPGLMLPFLRHDQRTKSHGETLIVMKPRLVTLPPTEWGTHAAWTGTETKPRTAL